MHAKTLLVLQGFRGTKARNPLAICCPPLAAPAKQRCDKAMNAGGLVALRMGGA
jgi:hypothetical protein